MAKKSNIRFLKIERSIFISRTFQRFFPNIREFFPERSGTFLS